MFHWLNGHETPKLHITQSASQGSLYTLILIVSGKTRLGDEHGPPALDADTFTGCMLTVTQRYTSLDLCGDGSHSTNRPSVVQRYTSWDLCDHGSHSPNRPSVIQRYTSWDLCDHGSHSPNRPSVIQRYTSWDLCSVWPWIIQPQPPLCNTATYIMVSICVAMDHTAPTAPL